MKKIPERFEGKIYIYWDAIFECWHFSMHPDCPSMTLVEVVDGQDNEKISALLKEQAA